MDPRLLSYYNRELQHVREMGGEFALAFPKIAGRLGLEGFECADPYVERLLEGFAFMAARVQLKIDAEFPRFTQHLLEMVYPHYLAPTPSMTVVQLQPDHTEGSLAEGVVVPRDTSLRSMSGDAEGTVCEYRTGHEVTLWPLELVEAEYYGYAHDVAALDVPDAGGATAALRLRLRSSAGLTFDKLALDRLPVFLRGPDELPMHLYEQLIAHASATIVRPTQHPAPWHEVIPRSQIHQVGFDEAQALLPQGPRSFEGYRLLREYFAFPQRFMLVELAGLAPAVRRCDKSELDLIVLFDRNDPVLEQAVDASNFALFCTPAINLFPKRTDRIHLADSNSPYHVVVDRTKPIDFEIYEVRSATGHGASVEIEQKFSPFYGGSDRAHRNGDAAYFAVQREPRVMTSGKNGDGPRSRYVGSEVFVSLVDAQQAPFDRGLRQLALTTLCTNRDLPLLMPVGRGTTDFTLESGAPVQSVRCVAGPTQPKPSHAEGETAWRLISHLSLNYLSLVDNDEAQGATALRELLSLYGDDSEATIGKQVNGVRSVTTAPVTRRLSNTGPIAFGRGLEITLTFDDVAFEGTGSFLLGAVLERFLAKYVSLNSFTETVVRTLDRGELIRWPARTGTRQIL